MTLKQARFVEFYDGNGRAAAAAAGYQGSDAVLSQTAYELLRNPEIRSEIEGRSGLETFGEIANRESRQRFWTTVMNDPAMSMRDRLRASELLGKSEADFKEREASKARPTLGELIEASFKVAESEDLMIDQRQPDR